MDRKMVAIVAAVVLLMFASTVAADSVLDYFQNWSTHSLNAGETSAFMLLGERVCLVSTSPDGSDVEQDCWESCYAQPCAAGTFYVPDLNRPNPTTPPLFPTNTPPGDQPRPTDEPKLTDEPEPTNGPRPTDEPILTSAPTPMSEPTPTDKPLPVVTQQPTLVPTSVPLFPTKQPTLEPTQVPQETTVCLCHKDEKANGKVNWVTKCFKLPTQQNALDAHKAHGDKDGACP